MSTSRLLPRNAFGAVMLVVATLISSGVLADYPPGSSAGANDLPNSLPQDGLISSIKQSLKESAVDVVRGHFDVGTPPNAHRYYCLVNPNSGALEPNGVLGDPVARPDGMTGIKQSAVSLYRCAKAEQQGILVTEGYVLTGRAALGVARAHADTPPAQPPAAAAAPAPMPAAPMPAAPMPAPAAAPAATLGAASAPPPAPANQAPPAPLAPPVEPRAAAVAIDVSGVKLGMSLDEVRGALKAKKLPQYQEWTETLSYNDAHGAPHPLGGGRFVNAIAAWNPPSGGGSLESSGESFEVMFAPVPGKERAIAIVHSVGYPAARAIHEAALEDGLVRKYGGFAAAGDLPQSPTWRFQSDGTVAVGDACNRRGLFGGLRELDATNAARENVALRKSTDELRYQAERCGSAIVTEDHVTENGGALREDRLVTRYTVSAYSPVLALQGAGDAAKLIQASGREAAKSDTKSTSEPPPDL